ncbi:MAG: class I SAM-dependent methyltransferase [Verrucomicrobiota bacterium]|nr:class I SAM-dependent methyltransferase [Verrucomicrobiota bacterium]
MNTAVPPAFSDEYIKDLEVTIRNRASLAANKNLLFWYERLYQEQFRELRDLESRTILEIGSGVSPLTRFYPTVLTSDVLQLDYLDYVFDCHQIDNYAAIADQSLDVITLTNVLHHLKSPLDFLAKAAVKLKPGGVLIATEPHFSFLSTVINKLFHHEPVQFSIDKPELSEVRGPLSSANQALAWLIFRRPEWSQRVAEHFDFEPHNFRPFTALSYFLTGGISRRFPIPHFIYRVIFSVDLWLSRVFPRLTASFFTIRLMRRP